MRHTGPPPPIATFRSHRRGARSIRLETDCSMMPMSHRVDRMTISGICCRSCRHPNPGWLCNPGNSFVAKREFSLLSNVAISVIGVLAVGSIPEHVADEPVNRRDGATRRYWSSREGVENMIRVNEWESITTHELVVQIGDRFVERGRIGRRRISAVTPSEMPTAACRSVPLRGRFVANASSNSRSLCSIRVPLDSGVVFTNPDCLFSTGGAAVTVRFS